MEQFIFPIYCRGELVGQGFIADGYFITAAHVVKGFPGCFTRIKGKEFVLSESAPELKLIGHGDINRDPNMIDIAVFRSDEYHSPLQLSGYLPNQGDVLNNYCKHATADISKLNPPHKMEMVVAIATGEEEGNYFYCKCKQYPGSSGSPLIIDNRVVGVMHGGDCNELCAFLKVEVILKMLP